MYKASNSYLNASQKLTRFSRTKIVVGEKEYSGAIYIKDAPKFSHSCSKMAGEFPIKSCEFSLWTKEEKIDLIDKEIKIYKGLILENDTIEWIPQGVFFSEKDDITTSDTGDYINIKCYDKAKKMSTIIFEDNSTYPIDDLLYIKNILSRYGYELENEEFPTMITISEKPNYEDGLNLREVVRRYAEIRGCNVIFSRTGKVHIKRPYDTNLIYKFYTYKKLTLEDKYGNIDRVILGNSNYNNDIVYPSKETLSLSNYDWKISNNPFVDLNKQANVISVYNNYKDLSVVPFKLENIIDNFILDINDIISVQKKDGTYVNLTILSIETQNRIKCNLSCDVQKPEDTDYALAGSIQKEVNKLSFNVDYNKNIIEGLVSRTSDAEEDITSLKLDMDSITEQVSHFDNQSQTIAQIRLSLDEINQQISAISDTTTSDKGTGKISLDGVNESNLIYLNIYPTKTDISYLYPGTDLYPDSLLYPLSRKLVLKNTSNNTSYFYDLPCDLLFYDADNYDEFIYDYNTESCYKIKRIGLNSSGNKYVLEEPTNEYFTFSEIILTEGNYEIYLLSFNDAMIQARAMVKNLYSAQYVTQTQFNARINQTKNDINASVTEKITLANNKIEELSGELDIQASEVALKLNASNFTSSAVIGLINNRDGTSTAKINASNINLDGYVTISNLSGNGTTTIDGSNIKTGTISAARLDSKVITTDNFSAQNISADRIVSGTLTAASINLGNGTFKVSTAGALAATNATINGTIKAGNGSTIGGLTMSNGVLSSSRLSLNATAGIVSVFNESGGSMILSNAARLSATAGIGISSNSNGNISAPSKNIDLKACNGASVYLACMRGNASSAISSLTVANGAGYWSGGTFYVNNTPVGSSSSINMKKNIKVLNQDFKDCLYNVVKNMNVYSFDFKKKYVNGLKGNVGFIIEEIENTILANILHIKNDKNDKNIKYYSDNDLTRVNLILIKELMNKIDILEKRAY